LFFSSMVRTLGR